MKNGKLLNIQNSETVREYEDNFRDIAEFGIFFFNKGKYILFNPTLTRKSGNILKAFN